MKIKMNLKVMSKAKFAIFFITSFGLCQISYAQDKKESERIFKIQGQDILPYVGPDSTGKLDGIHTDLIKGVCEKIKVKCQFDVIPLSRSFVMMESGEADMVCAIANTPERAKIMHLMPLLTKSGYTFFLPKGEASKYKKIEDFHGKSVVVLKKF